MRPDVEAQLAKVTHQAGKTPSPKAMWEAVEKAGFKPKKIESPAGTFTEKPKS